jgi:hypothetical protein
MVRLALAFSRVGVGVGVGEESWRLGGSREVITNF